MALLFTGACGYIGSHTARAFLEKTKENIIIIDDLSTGFLEHIKALERYYPNRVAFIQANLNETQKLDAFLNKQQLKDPIEAILHFGAKISVEESTRLPLEYYTNNTLNTLRACQTLLKTCNQAFYFFFYGRGLWRVWFKLERRKPLKPH